jgi:hypothetical protein
MLNLLNFNTLLRNMTISFSWDECLEKYLDPFSLENLETILGIDDLPELTQAPITSEGGGSESNPVACGVSRTCLIWDYLAHRS